jgi:predicted nucleic acid-binding protein
MSEAVLDAGPLIHLAELEALDTLMDFSALFVPMAAKEEVECYEPRAMNHPDLSLQYVFAPLPPPSLVAMGRALALDKGEMEALSLIDLHPKAIFLTDDSAARLAAEHRGIKAHGTIGILIRSVRQRHRTERDIIDLLRDLPSRSTLYIRPSLLAEIIRALEEEWKLVP